MARHFSLIEIKINADILPQFEHNIKYAPWCLGVTFFDLKSINPNLFFKCGNYGIFHFKQNGPLVIVVNNN
jgi:hypothetical protein